MDDCGIPSRKVKPYRNVGTEQKRVVWPAKVGKRAKGPCEPGLSLSIVPGNLTGYFACSVCSLYSLSNDGRTPRRKCNLASSKPVYEVIQFDPAAEKEPRSRIGKINLSSTIRDISCCSCICYRCWDDMRCC